MSDSQGPGDQLSDQMNESEDDDTLAFEYAAGTLRGQERDDFERRLIDEPGLQERVDTWNEQLMQLQGEIEPLPPGASTWEAISARVAEDASGVVKPVDDSRGSAGLFARLIWGICGAAASMLVAVLWLGQADSLPGKVPPGGAQVDYVAVLTTTEGAPALTTLGTAETRQVQLHWQSSAALEDQDYQLWAISKRDGQIRSVAIIDDNSEVLLELNPAHWRLVTDAESLILTIEDSGGSALDEPSDMLVARGVCVRVNQAKVQG